VPENSAIDGLALPLAPSVALAANSGCCHSSRSAAHGCCSRLHEIPALPGNHPVFLCVNNQNAEGRIRGQRYPRPRAIVRSSLGRASSQETQNSHTPRRALLTSFRRLGSVDAKLGLHSNLVANVTVKTDFANADVDIQRFNSRHTHSSSRKSDSFSLRTLGSLTFPWVAIAETGSSLADRSELTR
jgi:hypothetical protein